MMYTWYDVCGDEFHRLLSVYMLWPMAMLLITLVRPLGASTFPGAIIIESCTVLCATTLLSMAQNSDAVHRTSPLVESTEAPWVNVFLYIKQTTMSWARSLFCRRCRERLMRSSVFARLNEICSFWRSNDTSWGQTTKIHWLLYSRQTQEISRDSCRTKVEGSAISDVKFWNGGKCLCIPNLVLPPSRFQPRLWQCEGWKWKGIYRRRWSALLTVE